MCVQRSSLNGRFRDNVAANISGSILPAGSKTTVSNLFGFVQVMAIWPEIERVAPEELDRVC